MPHIREAVLHAGGELPPLHISPQASTDIETTQPSFTSLVSHMPAGYLRRTLSSLKQCDPPDQHAPPMHGVPAAAHGPDSAAEYAGAYQYLPKQQQRSASPSCLHEHDCSMHPIAWNTHIMSSCVAAALLLATCT